jgi:hypothetical protein
MKRSKLIKRILAAIAVGTGSYFALPSEVVDVILSIISSF